MIYINAKIHTKAKNPRIIQIGETLHVYVLEVARENRANEAVIGAIASYYGVSKSAVRLVKGQKSTVKIFAIYGDVPAR
jgi:uncharacterized protein YggU (UPF0235/DUF167 family)